MRPGRLLAAAAASAALAATGASAAGPAASPQPLLFAEPTGLAVEPSGALLVVESGRQRLVRVASGRVTRIASFVKPWGVARAADGSIFVGDGGALVRVGLRGAETRVAEAPPGDGIGPIAVAGGDVFYATDAALYRLAAGTPRRVAPGLTLHGPHGLAARPDRTLLVSDTNANRILAVDPASGKVTPFATLGHPRGIGVAPDGTVYVAAADPHRIVRFDASGRRLGAIGPRFTDPYALAVAQDGTVYALEVGPWGFVRRIGRGGSASVVHGTRRVAAVSARAWGEAPRLPAPRSAHAVLVAAGAIHVLGGPGPTGWTGSTGGRGRSRRGSRAGP